MEGVSKNCSDFKTCSNLSYNHLKIDCYKYVLVYIKYIVATNRKSIRDTQERNSNTTLWKIIQEKNKKQEERKRKKTYKNNQ